METSRGERRERRRRLAPVGEGNSSNDSLGLPPPAPPLRGGAALGALPPLPGIEGGNSRTTTPRVGVGSGSADAGEGRRRGGRRRKKSEGEGSEEGGDDAEAANAGDVGDEASEQLDRVDEDVEAEEREMPEPRRLDFDPDEEEDRAGEDFDVDPRGYDEEGMIAMEMDDIIEDDKYADLAFTRSPVLVREGGSQSVAQRAITKPQHFYENVFTGGFDRVHVARQTASSSDMEASDPRYEQVMLRSGVDIVLYVDSTIGLAARGLIAGMALNTLTASYMRCTSDYFAFCYVMATGYVLKMTFFLLNLVVLVAAVLVGTADDSDPPFHLPLLVASFICYSVAYIATVFAAPVDDQIAAYEIITTASAVSGTTISPPASFGFEIITEQIWHILNVSRYGAMIGGWVFTCIDRVYMTIQLHGYRPIDRGQDEPRDV